MPFRASFNSRSSSDLGELVTVLRVLGHVSLRMCQLTLRVPLVGLRRSAAVAALVRKTRLRARRRIRSGRVNTSGVRAFRASEVSGHRLDAEGLQSGPACVEVRLQRVAQARLPRCMDVLRDAVERLLLWIDGEEVGNLVRHTDNVADVHGATVVLIGVITRPCQSSFRVSLRSALTSAT